jgi:hypothetical protein
MKESSRRRCASVADGSVISVKRSFERLPTSDLAEDLAFSPEGMTFATACKNGMVKLWDVATAKETASLAAVAPKEKPRAGRMPSCAGRPSVFVAFG